MAGGLDIVVLRLAAQKTAIDSGDCTGSEIVPEGAANRAHEGVMPALFRLLYRFPTSHFRMDRAAAAGALNQAAVTFAATCFYYFDSFHRCAIV